MIYSTRWGLHEHTIHETDEGLFCQRVLLFGPSIDIYVWEGALKLLGAPGSLGPPGICACANFSLMALTLLPGVNFLSVPWKTKFCLQDTKLANKL